MIAPTGAKYRRKATVIVWRKPWCHQTVIVDTLGQKGCSSTGNKYDTIHTDNGCRKVALPKKFKYFVVKFNTLMIQMNIHAAIRSPYFGVPKEPYLAKCVQQITQ